MGSCAELGDAVQPAAEEQHSDLTPGEIRLRRLPAAGGAIAGVVWQLPDGRWMMVDGNSTEDEILRFARGLRPGTG